MSIEVETNRGSIGILGVPLGYGAGQIGSELGVEAIRLSNIRGGTLSQMIAGLGYEVRDFGNVDIARPLALANGENPRYLPEMIASCENMATALSEVLDTGHLPVILGGDHSIAIGTFSAISSHYRARGEEIGLIWFDAHADINTPETSASGNIHGMPLAVLLGEGTQELVEMGGFSPKLNRNYFAHVGARDLDAGERDRIRSHGIRDQFFTMSDIDKRGMLACIEDAISIASKAPGGFAVTFDIDMMDPTFAPGSGTLVRGGTTYREAHLALEVVAAHGGMRSFEIVEVNPLLDQSNITVILAVELILSALGKTILLIPFFPNMKTRIGVVFGGRSGEHEISLRSAKTVIEQLDQDKYTVVPIAIDHGGRWLDPRSSSALLLPETISLIDGDILEIDAKSIAFIGDPKYRGLTDLSRSENSEQVHRIDVIFPVLHGTFGEDGTIQGLCEMADIPYVGCGVLASACGMDKVVMKTLFAYAGLPICKHEWFLRRDWENDQNSVLDKVEGSVKYPCFVKPANLGSSVGISRADDRDSLAAAITEAALYDRKIIVEEGLKIREIECAVLGNYEPVASQPGEYMIKDKEKVFLDYTEKYAGTGNNEFVVPAPLSAELSKKIQELAVTAFKAVDGSGLARVDFFLRTDNGALLVNEINTMPGLTDASGYPKMWQGSGRPFGEILDMLIALAIERHADKARNRTSRIN